MECQAALGINHANIKHETNVANIPLSKIESSSNFTIESGIGRQRS
jgi:hypothetical protein